jgi:O-antigen/teichoic acid export membrane protein
VIYIVEMVIELGMVKLAIRELAREPERMQELVSALQLWRLGLGLLGYIGVVLTVNIAGYPAEYRPIFYFVGITMILELLAGGFNVVFQSQERFRYSAQMDITVKAGVLGFGLVVILLNGPVWGIALSTMLATSLTVIEGFVWSRRFTKINLKVRFTTVKWLVWRSLPFWGTTVLLVIYTYIDSIMLEVLAGDKAVGWYASPVRLFNTSLFLPTALSTAVFPALSRLYVTDRNEMLALSSRSLRWLVMASLPISVMVMTLSANFIPLLYGDKFQESVPVMAILGATLFSTYISMLTNQFLIVTNRQLEWTKVMAVATVLNPIINLFLINYFKGEGNGAIGAAWSLFITETLMLIPAFLLLPRGIFNRSLIIETAKIGLACVPMATTVLWLDRWFVVIPAVSGAIVFIICASVLKALPLDELKQARKMLLERHNN